MQDPYGNSDMTGTTSSTAHCKTHSPFNTIPREKLVEITIASRGQYPTAHTVALELLFSFISQLFPRVERRTPRTGIDATSCGGGHHRMISEARKRNRRCFTYFTELFQS